MRINLYRSYLHEINHCATPVRAMTGCALESPSARFAGLSPTHLEMLQRTVEEVWQVGQGLLGHRVRRSGRRCTRTSIAIRASKRTNSAPMQYRGGAHRRCCYSIQEKDLT